MRELPALRLQGLRDVSRLTYEAVVGLIGAAKSRYGHQVLVDPLCAQTSAQLGVWISFYSFQPLRYLRLTYWDASGAFLARIFGPSHSSFLPVRIATQPSSMISVR